MDPVDAFLAQAEHVLSLIETKDMVRTPEGAEKYGQPINTVIVRDVVPSLPDGWTDITDPDFDPDDGKRRFLGPNSTVVLYAIEDDGSDGFTEAPSEDDLMYLLGGISTLQQIAPIEGMFIEIDNKPFRLSDMPITANGYSKAGGTAIHLRPRAIVREYATAMQAAGNLMPVMSGPKSRLYALTHEWGHCLDHRPPAKVRSDYDAMFSSSQGGMSRYSIEKVDDVLDQITNPQYGYEAFAEAFAGWVGSQGTFAKPYTMVGFYARKYGWDDGSTTGQPHVTEAKAAGEFWICDTFTDDGAIHIPIEFDDETKSAQRHVRDAAFWGAPVGTPLPLAHRGGTVSLSRTRADDYEITKRETFTSSLVKIKGAEFDVRPPLATDDIPDDVFDRDEDTLDKAQKDRAWQIVMRVGTRKVGEMYLADDGEVLWIEVPKSNRRKGYGTALWDFANDLADSGYYIASPHHSWVQTDEGRAWADALDEQGKSIASSFLTAMETKVRHVATEEGAEYYGVPIGTPLPLPRAKPISIPAERMARVTKVDGDTVAKRLAGHDAYTQSLADWSSVYGYAGEPPEGGWDWDQIVDGLTEAGPFRAVDLGNGVVVCANERGYGNWGAHRPADKNKFDTAVANAIILGDNAPRPGMTIQLSQWVEEANPSYEQGVLASSVSGDHHMVIYPPLLDLELGYPTPSGYAVPMSLQMMAHEWGHAVMPDMDGWTDEQIEIIDSIFNADPGNYISQYAMADPHEAFAEAFMDWFTSGGHPNTSADQAAKAFGWAEQFPLVLTMTEEAE